MSDSLESARALAASFRDGLRTVMLATSSATGEPDASIAAAVRDDAGNLCVLLSGLAAHTRNLAARPQAGVLLAEDEGSMLQPLARRRLSLTCTAERVARDSPEFPLLMARFRTSFGATIDTVIALPDFQLFRLVPRRGRLIAGFGAAFDADPRDWTQLRPPGRPAPSPDA